MRKKIAFILAVALLCALILPQTALAFDVIKKGSTGSDVKEVQQYLITLGYLSGSADGKFGSGTEAAVKKYQKAEGLTADGKVGEKTYTALKKDAEAKTSSGYKKESFPISRGMKGDYTKYIQNVLKKHGFSVTADGKFGSGTEAAVKKYQKMHNLTADGKVGTKTWKSIRGTAAVSLEPKTSFPIEKGAQGYDVLVIQTALNAHKLSSGTDEKFGSTVEKNVKKYQKMHGLSQTGKVDSKTWKSMVAGIKIPVPTAEIQLTKSRFPLNSKSSKEDLLAIQNALIQLGYELEATGKWNKATKTAVTAYQEATEGLEVTKVIDLPTWEALAATEEDKENVLLLAKLIRRESNESDNAQLAVARVAINYAQLEDRSITAELKSGRYSPCKNWSKFLETKHTEKNLKNAKRAYYEGISPFGELKPLYFHSKSVTPAAGSWWRKLICIGRLDDNVYYAK